MSVNLSSGNVDDGSEVLDKHDDGEVRCVTSPASPDSSQGDPTQKSDVCSTASAESDGSDLSDPISPKVVPTRPPRFDPADAAGINKYLDKHGYVVVSGVMSQEALRESVDLFWDFLSNGDPDGLHVTSKATKCTGPVRGDLSTWDDDRWKTRVSMPHVGLINSGGIGHSAFAWHIRVQPGVKQAFQSIWGTAELFTSFDGGNAFRPWAHGHPEWKTRNGWYHVDQGRNKPKKCCVQGLVAVTAATEHTGGLVVIPESHHDFAGVLERNGSFGDFVSVRAGDPVLSRAAALICADAGDLVLWDSRTVHCNTSGLTPGPPPDADASPELLRIAGYVCMTPARWCSREVIERRREAFKFKQTTSHWPHEFVATGDGLVHFTDGKNRDSALSEAAPAIRALVDGGSACSRNICSVM